MTIKIRNDINNNGIKIENTRNCQIYELQISQYADDTTLNLLNTLAIVSGFKINIDKTVVIGIGLFKNRCEKI